VYKRDGFGKGFQMRPTAAVMAAAMVFVLGGCGDKAKPPVSPLSEEANAAYLKDNAKKSGVVSVPGIQYEVLQKGDGPQPSRKDCVTVNYKGSLIDGKVFDQTEPGAPATFPAGRLIPGWVQALQMMHTGEKWRLIIPSGLAYGKEGAGGVIPPNQTLVFEVELLKVIPGCTGAAG
jgi:FKBP-type peptidyl-prolyl cis-trans isomerase FklB